MELIKLTKLGKCCVYCGTETEGPCCEEIRHEQGFCAPDGEIILESELTNYLEREKTCIYFIV